MTSSSRDSLRRLSVLMAAVFVDMMGFLMVLPLLPFYAERLGASAFVIGLLVSAFAFAQLATAPLWGRLSDRYGRRPALLVGLGASALAYLIFGLADTVWLLFLSRLAQGAGGGTTGVVQAYVSDTVEPHDRAKALGWLSAATSAGVMLGPALGSLAIRWGPAAPGYLAAGLCLLNVVMAWRWLPESRVPPPLAAAAGGPGADAPPPAPRRPLGQALLEVVRHPGMPVSLLVWIYAAGMMAFMAMNAVLALFLARRFGVTEHTIGWFYTYVGGISLVMRSLVLGPAVLRLGEIGVLRLGIWSLLLGFLLLPFSQQLATLGVVILLVPVGTALLFPATSSLVSRLAPPGETGQTLGVQQTFGGVARMLGPVWAGAAFEHLGMAAPFWISSGLMLAVYLGASRLAPPAAAKPAAAPPELPAERRAAVSARRSP